MWPTPPDRWEHVIVHAFEGDISSQLAQREKDGWQLCGVTVNPDVPAARELYFKKLKPQPLMTYPHNFGRSDV